MNSIGSDLVSIDRYSDYVPFVSTVTTITNLFQKIVLVPLLGKERIENSHYYTYLNQKSFLRSITLLVPVIGNILVYMYDSFVRQYNDPEYILYLVGKDFRYMGGANEELKGDQEFVFRAFQTNAKTVCYLSKELKKNKEFMLKLVKEDPRIINSTISELCEDRDFMLAAAKIDSRTVLSAGYNLLNNKEFMMRAIEIDARLSDFASESVSEDEDFQDYVEAQMLHQGGSFSTQLYALEPIFTGSCIIS